LPAYGFNARRRRGTCLPEAIRDHPHGTGGKAGRLTFRTGAKLRREQGFEGVIGNLNRRLLQTESAWMREELASTRPRQPCETCGGARLKPEALRGEDRGRGHQHLHPPLSVADALCLVPSAQGKADRPAARSPRPSSRKSTSGWASSTMSGSITSTSTAQRHAVGRGSQRIRLASQIGSGLSGVLYVLDEPSIGLHQRDNDRLLETLKRLRDLGNTVIVVEHDEDAIRHADYIVDMGPGAGVHGGESRGAQGTLPTILEAAEGSRSPADYLTGRREILVPKKRRKGTGKKLTVQRRARQQPARTSRPRSRSAPSPASPASPARASPASRSTRSMPPPRAR
jgi:excinuclease ABC subunit A